MAEVLLPPDPEIALLSELDNALDEFGFPISQAAQTLATIIAPLDPRPDEFMRVLSVGGADADLVTDAFTLTIEAYAVDETRGFGMLSAALGWLGLAARRGRVGYAYCRQMRVVSLPAKLPDPRVTSHVRWTATISVVLRRTAVQVPDL